MTQPVTAKLRLGPQTILDVIDPDLPEPRTPEWTGPASDFDFTQLDIAELTHLQEYGYAWIGGGAAATFIVRISHASEKFCPDCKGAKCSEWGTPHRDCILFAISKTCCGKPLTYGTAR